MKLKCERGWQKEREGVCRNRKGINTGISSFKDNTKRKYSISIFDEDFKIFYNQQFKKLSDVKNLSKDLMLSKFFKRKVEKLQKKALKEELIEYYPSLRGDYYEYG